MGALRAGCPPHSSQVTEPLPGRSLPRMEELGTKAGGGQPSVFILNKQKTKRNKQQRGRRMRQSAGAQGQARYLQGNRTRGTYYGNRYSLAHPPPAGNAATRREKHKYSHSHWVTEGEWPGHSCGQSGVGGEPQAPNRYGKRDVQDPGTDTQATRHRHALHGLTGQRRPRSAWTG